VTSPKRGEKVTKGNAHNGRKGGRTRNTSYDMGGVCQGKKVKGTVTGEKNWGGGRIKKDSGISLRKGEGEI